MRLPVQYSRIRALPEFEPHDLTGFSRQFCNHRAFLRRPEGRPS